MSTLSEPKPKQSRDPLPPPGVPAAAMNPLNPHTDPVAYLLGKGWRCLGNPEWSSSLWLDPTQPLAAYYTEEPCTYQVEVREEYVDKATNSVKVRYKLETRQVLAQDGRGGAAQAARRKVYHPKGTPMTVSQALMIQIERDASETLKAEEARRKADEEKGQK